MEGDLEVRTWKGQSGVYALREFEPGEYVMPIEGMVSSEPSRYSVQVSTDRHLHPTGAETPWKYLNHSCSPNLAYHAASRTFVARKLIEPNEQLSFNYLTTEWEMAEFFDCACGADACFGRIAGFRHLDEHAKERLIDESAPHIRVLEEARSRKHDASNVDPEAHALPTTPPREW